MQKRSKKYSRLAICVFLAVTLVFQGFIPGIYPFAAVSWAAAPDPAVARVLATGAGLGPLSGVPTPQPANIGTFVRDTNVAVRLGKALFWDMQVGSDGQACGSCHFQAGADNRVKNQISPGLNGGDAAFGNNPFTGLKDAPGFGPGATLTAADFPLHLLSDTTNNASPVLRDTNDVVASQGVFKANYLGSNPALLGDDGIPAPEAVFKIGGVNMRQVTERHTPTMINAIFSVAAFWDGRAHMFFNGVNPFGPLDTDSGVYVNTGGVLTRQVIRIPLSSIASVAVGPPVEVDEMSFIGRSFPAVGRKLIPRQPLAFQKVHPQDSVLGTFSLASLGQNGTITGQPGLNTTYRALIEAAFNPEYWNSAQLINGYTQMETNFSLFFGLAVQLYVSTLVSNRSPFDRFMEGDDSALTGSQINGMNLFHGKGGCAVCHVGPEFTDASVGFAGINPSVPGSAAALLDLMIMEDGTPALYDAPFHNNGVRPTAEDKGRGGTAPFLNPLTGQPYPLAASRLAILKAQDLLPASVAQYVPDLPVGIPPLGIRAVADGEFKTPGLRNIELTGPYFHNGGQATLGQVIEFYDRGGDFIDLNKPDSDALAPLIGFAPQEEVDLTAFLLSLTDDRVRNEQAPFDHPQIFIPNGNPGGGNLIACISNLTLCNTLQEIPPVGALGRPAANLGPLTSFLGIEQTPLQVGLRRSLESPQPAGAVVTFAANPVGGSGSYEFEFLLQAPGSGWTVVQPYSPLLTWSWVTTGLAQGGYAVAVQARNLGSTAAFDARLEMPYVIGKPPATGASLTASPAGPQPGGTLATFNAVAAGASGSYEYQFLLTIAGVSSVMQSYSASPFWVWNTAGYANGTYSITVWARTIGSTVPFESTATTPYVLAPRAQVGVTLAAAPASPVLAGRPVTFTAAGQGGSGPYEYRFWLLQGDAWSVVQPYSPTAVWNWNTAGAAKGNHIIQVDIRKAGSTAERESAQAMSINILSPSVLDFDGDGKKDIAVWRPTDGKWYVVRSSDGAFTATQWGANGDIPVAGDYDGDGKTDLALWRPADGNWYISRSSTGALTATPWGANGDIPVPGDYDGDGKTDLAVWRPATATWWVIQSSNGAVTTKQWGANGDIPVAGDYDGDGKTDLAIWRPADGNWWIIRSSNGTVTTKQWGINGDNPVPGDYDGDGKADLAIWRPASGTWWTIQSSSGAVTTKQWGVNGDIPVAGDYDGDGKADPAIWRPADANWFIVPSRTGVAAQIQWGGGPVDVPIGKLVR